MSLYIDVTEFLINPIRTGIQRIEGEICRFLPEDQAIPVRYHNGHYLSLPPELIQAIGRYFREGSRSGAGEILKIGSPKKGVPLQICEGDTILIPEIFTHERAVFFSGMPAKQLNQCRFIVYDLLALTHPQFFPPDFRSALSSYFHVLRLASHCGFISEHTRDTYHKRLKRSATADGVVLPLGCDSLGPRQENVSLDRPPTFTVVGTIEPRKNHALILDAFEPLLRQIPGLRLAFVGKMGWVDPTFGARVHAIAADKNSGFEFVNAPDDGTIKSYIERSRATIYVSAAEGYGLPPVESLWLGTPVIASTPNPSLTRLGSAGVHYVEPLNVINLRASVLAFLDNSYANKKTMETLQLDLPTWRSFACEVLRWCTSSS
jgi:glycosyltransferase involved in cell wall biosynthesis